MRLRKLVRSQSAYLPEALDNIRQAVRWKLGVHPTNRQLKDLLAGKLSAARRLVRRAKWQAPARPQVRTRRAAL